MTKPVRKSIQVPDIFAGHSNSDRTAARIEVLDADMDWLISAAVGAYDYSNR